MAENVADGQFAVSDFETHEYNTDFEKKGRAVIINNIVFAHGSQRPASVRDGERVQAILKELDFHDDDICYKDNLAKDDMYKLLHTYSGMDYADYAGFLCIIMTHGNQSTLKDAEGEDAMTDVVIGSDGKPIGISLLTELFTHRQCVTLKGKPKVFVIQACRGNEVSEPADINRQGAYKSPMDHSSNTIPIEVPVHTDFLLAYATQPGFMSFKDKYPSGYEEYDGSWFIVSLCEEISRIYKEARTTDIRTLLREVSRSVAFLKRSYSKNKNLNNKKEMPWVASRLTKKIQFGMCQTETGTSEAEHQKIGCSIS